MRHGVKGRKLSRTAAHRKRTLQSLSMALIKEHRIMTTLAKAKELRVFVEPLITRAKEDTHHNRRQVFSSLQNKEAVSKLFEEVGPKSKDRPGGYTRIIKAGLRKGDGAEMAVVELVDYNDIKPEGTTKSSGKKRTRRAGKSNTPTSSTPSTKKGERESKTEVAEQKEATSEDVSEETKAEENSEEEKNS
ncbi:50S ribosomal protein L17 [Gracilimonas mengyeensis]|uniref:Large ribosomal subunit protein bL17 n=1 Tax=Gracilimonas mengyeensis TaxID=1302730 RepID=A0A521FPK7_9BACT|nr:LSU ribosomal protein L17P [Gracilimonas mengyeensis]